MNIATQLKRLEATFETRHEEPPTVPLLSPEDSDTLKKVFSLAPSAFVDAWARALALSENECSQADKEILVRAIRSGTSRLKIIDAMYARKWTLRSPLEPGSPNDICRAQDQFVLIENVELFAPGNDAAFVRYAFRQICDRDPEPKEQLAFDFDLRCHALDRRAAIKKIVRIANHEGRVALWDSLNLEEDQSDPTCARTMPTGFAYDEHGREALIFVRELSDGGWAVAPDVLRQSPKMEQRGWSLEEGWIITGPKRSLRPGRWRVDLNILQEDHVLDLDVVANSGLDVLQKLSICGSFSGSFSITVLNHHRFVELRLLAREVKEGSWVNPRNISMCRLP